MKSEFDIHGTSLEVETGKEGFRQFLEKRLKSFQQEVEDVDMRVSVHFEAPEFDEDAFSDLGAGTQINENEMIYSDGPLKCRVSMEDELQIAAYLDPETWKHYGRMAKKGKERTWNEYYEYFIIRRAIQLPLMWKMQQKGFYPVHASAVEKDGEAYVFTGFGGVGKTTLGLYLAENDYKLMADNLVFLKDGKVYPYPEMLRVTDFTVERTSILEKTGERVFGQEIVETDDKNIASEPTELEKIFLLNRGKFRTSDVENDVDRLLGLADNLQEFHTHHYPSLFSFITDENIVSREQIYRESLEDTKVKNLSYSSFEDVKELIGSDEK
ncbi:MAG: hypothetical protein BRC29_00805 [Nanohaloarchaea archaeon SW_7_43_1]|nr:MAG: hypothetical protein BRC29_00805 [Nanohaloarchaea archaeon SW_7_43_1]